jgi:AcrR family transcriptional regulator
MTALQRDAVRTRKALLAAAEQEIATHGPSVSLDAVARAAGVSKGGLLHHFRSRDALFTALVAEWLDRFDAAVARHADPGDDRPGRLCRAFVRATFDDPAASSGPWVRPAVQAALLVVPAVRDLAEAAAQRWDDELRADGLPRDRVILITRAADGLAMADLFTGTAGDRVDREELRDLLLALTESTEPLAGRP